MLRLWLKEYKLELNRRKLERQKGREKESKLGLKEEQMINCVIECPRIKKKNKTNKQTNLSSGCKVNDNSRSLFPLGSAVGKPLGRSLISG